MEGILSFNVIEILKLGLPGLVFLLALLSFKLLSNEQNKPSPSPDVLKLIKYFMTINIVLALLTVAAPIFEYNFLSGDGTSRREVVNTVAKIDSSNLKPGVAAVCQGSKYANRYLLVSNTAMGLVQVYAERTVPCSDSDKIVIHKYDASLLGWSSEITSEDVQIVAAPPGCRFIMNEQKT